MITVVDQVRPWLTPSSTLANTTHPHVGAQISSSGIGQRDDPAGDEDGLAAVAVGEGAGEEVRGGLDRAERDDERERGREGGEPELLLGEEREDGAFLADHAADERVDADEEGELGDVLLAGRAGAVRPASAAFVIACSRRRPVAVDQVSGPPSRTTTCSCPAAARMLAPVIARSPWPHMTVIGRRRARRRRASRVRC